MPTNKELVQKISTIRIRLAWHGPLVWVGHLDRMRSLERSLLRAKWPLYYSQGFNPRPQLVFALPSSVGIESDAEYIDISLEGDYNLEGLLHSLEKQLPKGITLLDAVELEESNKSCMALVRMCEYEFFLTDLAGSVRNLMLLDEIVVEKFSKGKLKQEECKQFILDVNYSDENTVVFKLMAGSMRNLRADLLLDALKKYENLAEADAARICKKELWLKPSKEEQYLVPAISRNPLNRFPWKGA